jgi:hypothetical protein
MSVTVTLDSSSPLGHGYTMPSSITIKQLHATTGEHVRRAGSARFPVLITDRGQPVAVLGSPLLVKPRSRKRTLLPEFAAMMAQPPGDDIQAALDEIRGDR